MKFLFALGISALMLGGCVMDGNKPPDDSAGYEQHDSPIDSLNMNDTTENKY